MTQALTLPVLGLVTDPGPFTEAPDGGMCEAQNVSLMRPGVIEPRCSTFFSADAVLKAGAYATQKVGFFNSVVFTWSLTGASTWILRKGSSATVVGPTSFTRGFIREAQTGGRTLFTSNNGVCTLPDQASSPSGGSATVAYRAGMPQPYVARVVATVAAAGFPAGANWLPNLSSVAYRFTLRRRLVDGTIVESAPSGRAVVFNAGVAAGITVTDSGGPPYFAWFDGVGFVTNESYGNLITRDELCIYRSPKVVGTPSDEMKLRAVLTWNPTLGGFYSVVDGVAVPWFDGLDDGAWNGPALYTNETQEGAALANYRPEYARDIALYNGMTFYAGARTAQRVDVTLKKIATGAPLATDPSQAMNTFASQGDITAGTNTILNATQIRYYSVGQVVAVGDPGTVSAAFPVANTFVTAINVATNTVTLSQNAGATVVGQAFASWDWIETSVAGSRIYHGNFAGAGRWFVDAQSLDNRWNGDLATAIQLRCSSVTQTEEILCSFFRSDPTGALFTVRSSKPNAWDRFVDRSSGVASQQQGGPAELRWSKVGEPEHCPVPYRSTIGDASQAIRRISVARNSLLVFKDDGLFQVFGSVPNDLQIELLDRTITLPTPTDVDEQSKWLARLDDRVFAMTTRGPMEISDTGGTPIGAPLLETLRQDFQFSYGGLSTFARETIADYAGRRVFFVMNDPVTSLGRAYVYNVDVGAWCTWTWRHPITCGTAFPLYGGALLGGGYAIGLTFDDRTMLNATTVATSDLPQTSDQWEGETCTVNSVTGTGPYTITIAAGSEWSPAVGDLLIRSGVAHEVTAVTSATVFESDTQPTTGVASWLESFECRAVWTARTEGNVGLEKHWRSLVLPFETTAITARLRSYFRGYRNTGAAIEAFATPSQVTGTSPWPLIPAYVNAAVPTDVARDWALRVGFSIQQAGVWFSSGGVSVLFEPTTAANKAAR